MEHQLYELGNGENHIKELNGRDAGINLHMGKRLKKRGQKNGQSGFAIVPTLFVCFGVGAALLFMAETHLNVLVAENIQKFFLRLIILTAAVESIGKKSGIVAFLLGFAAEIFRPVSKCFALIVTQENIC